MKCSNCDKDIECVDSYKCRICSLWFCDKCSLDHFGLAERNGRVVHKSVFKSFLWMLHKKFFRKD